MTFNKALKILKKKGNGYIVPIPIMESPVDSSLDFVRNFNEVNPVANAMFPGMSYSICSCFRLQPMGEPMQYATVNIDKKANTNFKSDYREDYPGQWQWYSFFQLFNKLGCIKLNFGLDEMNTVIRSSTEKNIDLYGL